LVLLTLLELEDGPLDTTTDLGPVGTLPADCTVMQIAVRGTGLLRSILRVERSFWRRSSPRERVLLAIHEGAHSWFPVSDLDIFSGTLGLRQFVGLLASGPFYRRSDEAIRELLLTRFMLKPERLTESGLR
jgi:hypothetical protein